MQKTTIKRIAFWITALILAIPTYGISLLAAVIWIAYKQRKRQKKSQVITLSDNPPKKKEKPRVTLRHSWLTPKKIALGIFLIIAIFIAWYITIPALLIWWFFKTHRISRKAKIISGIAVGGILLAIFMIGLSQQPGTTVSPEPIIIPELTQEQREARQKRKEEQEAKLAEEQAQQQAQHEAKSKARIEAREKAQAEADKVAAEEAEKQQAEQAAFDNSKAGQLCKTHPTWSKEECQGVADKKYWIGMEYDMLVASFGKPNSINPSNYGSGTSYQYCYHNWTPSCFYDNNDDGIIDAYN